MEKMGSTSQSKGWRLGGSSNGVKPFPLLAVVAVIRRHWTPVCEVAVDFLGRGRLYLLDYKQSPGHFQRALKYPLTISSGR